jgi:hypothetical protein
MLELFQLLTSKDARNDNDDNDDDAMTSSSRCCRSFFLAPASPLIASYAAVFATNDRPAYAVVVPTYAERGGNSMYSPKFVQTYDDFTTTSEGWS